MSFKEDKLANEKKEPIEGSSLKFINVPIVLLALLLGFGVTYLALRTNKVTMEEGDSRTVTVAAPKPEIEGELGLMAKGKQIFTTTCQACHQASGVGIPSVFPPLAGSEWVKGSPKRMVAIVLHGIQSDITVEGQKFQGVMPPFKSQLHPEDIAAVVSYVRQSFGNTAGVISADLVKQVVKETESRTASWAGEAELNTQKWE